MKELIALGYKSNADMILVKFTSNFHRMYSKEEFESILHIWNDYGSFAGIDEQYIYLIPNDELKQFDAIE